jgi:hypothetical protein
MQILPVDLVALAAVILGTSIVLVPVVGLTARFAFKPAAEALAKLLETRQLDETVRLLERRMELQEREIEALTTSLQQIADAREFDRRLAAPPPSDSPPV